MKLSRGQIVVLLVGVLLLVLLLRSRGGAPARPQRDPDEAEADAFADELDYYAPGDEDLMPVFPIGGYYETNERTGGGGMNPATGDRDRDRDRRDRPADRSFRFSVMSGRFDASNLALQADLRRERDASSLAFLTEQGKDERLKVLREDPDWWVARSPREGARYLNENVTTGDGKVWKLERAEFPVLFENAGGLGVRRQANPFAATVTVLRHRKTGRRLITLNTHLPAHLSKSSRFYHPDNILIWARTFRAVQRVKTRLRKQYPGAAFIIAWDGNMRLNRLRDRMQFAFPQFNFLGGGIFGNAWGTGVRSLGVRTLQAQGSDHEIERINATFTGS